VSDPELAPELEVADVLPPQGLERALELVQLDSGLEPELELERELV
jgi:hypothetical protein